MLINARTWIAPKRRQKRRTCQDAAHPGGVLIQQRSGFRCAVADGETNGVESAYWAQLLARSFCAGDLCDALIEKTIHRQARPWKDLVKPGTGGWMGPYLIHRGTGAALAGLMVRGAEFYEDRGDGAWAVTVFGDCAAFIVRDAKIQLWAPYQSAADFEQDPHLLMTPSTLMHRSIPKPFRAEGWWIEGDVFYLMSDALGRWFCKQAEMGERPWSMIDAWGRCEDDAPFTDWLERVRVTGELRDDDVVVTRLRVGKGETP